MVQVLNRAEQLQSSRRIIWTCLGYTGSKDWTSTAKLATILLRTCLKVSCVACYWFWRVKEKTGHWGDGWVVRKPAYCSCGGPELSSTSHERQLTTDCNSSSRALTLFWPPQASALMATYTQHTWTHKTQQKINPFLKRCPFSLSNLCMVSIYL